MNVRRQGRLHARGPEARLGGSRCGLVVHLPAALGVQEGCHRYLSPHRFEEAGRDLSCVFTAIEDLIDIAPGIKFQNEDHLVCLIYIINKPVFAKSYPESGLMPFALFNIKIGR